VSRPENDLCDCRVVHEESIRRARERALAEAEFADLAAFFKAFADPGRLRILQALEGGEMCVCDLAALSRASESAVSHQLRVLRQLKLVSNRREGPVLYYRLNDNHITELIGTALSHLRE